MKLVLGPTSMAQWQQLILEAEQACSVNLNENTESYLVFLLMRFIAKPHIAKSILGLEFLEGTQDLSCAREEKLREVGDKCLLYSGLFPGHAERRHVSVSYFVKLGQTAYGVLSEQSAHLTMLYQELCYKFIAMMEVLQTTRELSDDIPSLTPLQAYGLWDEVKSQHALASLRHYTDAMILPGNKQDKKH